jgi:multicomponent Na+:H+ antiporter subunit C
MIDQGSLPYVLSVLVLAVGIYAVSCKKNLIKVIVGVMIAEHAVNLFLLLMSYRATEGCAVAPILSKTDTVANFAATAADPTPQALILTSIVIGLGVVALMVAMALRLHEKYGTFDLSKIRSLRG